MRIKDFKELDCWIKSRELVNVIYKVTHNDRFSRDFGLKDQIRRAAVSVMSNIAEGFGTSSDADFARYLSISVRSAYEVESQLFIALDQNYITSDEFDRLVLLLEATTSLTKGLIRYLRRGTKT